MNNEFWAELSGVKKRFGKTVALDGLDLQVRPGELFSVLGPNGAGKSTAISLLLGLLKPDCGRCAPLWPLTIPRRATAPGRRMMQEVTLAPELRVREHVALVASYYPRPFTPAEAMELTNISSLASRPYGKLSAGQKRQVQFAMAVCGRPKLLFLDEPSVGLDVRARETMWATLRQTCSQRFFHRAHHSLSRRSGIAFEPRRRSQQGPSHRFGHGQRNSRAGRSQAHHVFDRRSPPIKSLRGRMWRASRAISSVCKLVRAIQKRSCAACWRLIRICRNWKSAAPGSPKLLRNSRRRPRNECHVRLKTPTSSRVQSPSTTLTTRLSQA